MERITTFTALQAALAAGKEIHSSGLRDDSDRGPASGVPANEPNFKNATKAGWRFWA